MQTAIIEALLYLLATLGIYTSFRILRFPDLSADNTYSFGAICGFWALISTTNIVASLAICFFGGFIVGGFTSILYSKFRISKLLSGIITYTILFSINLYFFNKPNVPLPNEFQGFASLYIIIDFLSIIILIYATRTCLWKTLLTLGSSPNIIEEYKISSSTFIFIGLGFSSAFISLSGFLSALYFGFCDTQFGFGVLIHGVAAILIGETVCEIFGIRFFIIKIFSGMLLYSLIIYFVFYLAPESLFSTSDNKLISGAIVIAIMIFNRNKQKDLVSI